MKLSRRMVAVVFDIGALLVGGASALAADAPFPRGQAEGLTAVYLILDGETTVQTALRVKSLLDPQAKATAVRDRAA